MDTMTGTIGDTIRTNDSDEAVSETVVNAVADAKGVDPLELDPLYDAVDPDALDSLFGHHAGAGSSSVELSFTMARCEVLVRGAGEVVVTPLAATEEAAERVTSVE
jgi:hypothetical protein